jgi:hypothetical protein
MLDAAVPDPDAEKEPATLYYSDGDSVFAARSHRPGVYHGYPIPGNEAPPGALRALVQADRITPAQYRRLLRQTALPERG